MFFLSFSLRIFYSLVSHSSSTSVCQVRVVSCLLFSLQGDLEQLAIVPNPSAVSQQCSATRVPLLDPALLQTTGSEVSSGVRERRGRRTKGRKGVDYHHSEPTAPWKFTNELGNLEDSASGTWKGTSPPKRKSEHDVISTEQKDAGTSSDSTDDDFYEDSDSEGSAQGEGQYGEDQ